MLSRPLILACFSALPLAACAPENGEDKSAPSVPLGFELAMAHNAPDMAVEASIVEIDPGELSAMLQGGNIRLIDVRRDDEVAGGMIAGAEHIPLDEFDPAKLDHDDGRQIVLYCRSGRRSAIAAERLGKHMGEPAVHLAGGFIAWKTAGGATD
ncbi:rhodanese-like domain-containing protein [Erythrobacter sp. GH1-10]|uniref:rhodanese-like domain-containing protein n=1 Tax=Erythrobacter sp. GH1-10 TaxID=3349334 RepID=UPI003877AB44